MRPLIILVTTLLLAWLAGGSPALGDTLADVRAGNAAFVEGRHDAAVEAYTRAILADNLDPESLAAAFNNRGVVYGEIGDLDSAIRDYGQALALRPGDRTATRNLRIGHSRRAAAHANLGEHDRALADYAKAIELESNHAPTYLSRGRLYLEHGEFRPAIADLSRARELDPSSKEAVELLEQANARLAAAMPVMVAPISPAGAPFLGTEAGPAEPPRPGPQRQATGELITAAAQDAPAAAPPAARAEVTAPAPLSTPDPAQPRVAELETQLAQRTQELETLQGQLRSATEQLAALQQQQVELAKERQTLSGQLAAMEQRVTMLERDLALAHEAEATTRALISERDIAIAPFGEEVATLNKVKGELEQQLAEAVQVHDASTRDVAARDQRIAALEHDLAEAQKTGGQARQEAYQLTHQVQELKAVRADLERQLAQDGQGRDQAAHELQSRAERIAVLERDATAAQHALKERSVEIERLTSELRGATEARDTLEEYAVERTKLLEQAGRDVRAGADRIEALEHDLGSAQQQVEERRLEVERMSQRVKELEGVRIALEQQLANMARARDQAARDLDAREQHIASLEDDLALSRETAEQSRAEAQRLNQQLTEATEARDQAVRDFQAREQPAAVLERVGAKSLPARHPADEASGLDTSKKEQASGAGYYVAAKHTNLRAEPSREATIVAVVEPGAVVRALDRRQGWLRVEYADRTSGKPTGWIFSALLRPTDAPSKQSRPAKGGGR
jgi:Flp pilus assembly protein TadD/predicted  nucleic acid-binding Zn-ribbon protein